MEIRIKRLVRTIIIAISLGLFIEYILNVDWNGYFYTFDTKLLSGAFDSFLIKRALIYAIVLENVILYWLDPKRFADFCYRHRWGIGLLFVIFCVLFELHGSSMGVLAKALTGKDISRLWGVERPIRSDEYVVFTQMSLSQVASGFQWFSDVWGYSKSDMFIVCGQPILNIMTIFRPFTVGYILLGAEKGLAFYWSSRLVVLFLVSFEFGRLLTNDNKDLTLCYSFLMVFSPLVQWWYSVNELVEMLIFGQAAILLIRLLIKKDSMQKKLLYSLGLLICVVGYAMTMYPAWMIPFFYVFLATFVSFIILEKKSIKIDKLTVSLLILVCFTMGICFAYIYHYSGDTIHAIMNTEYPGARIYTGGPLSNILRLFAGWSGWIWSFVDVDNPCELSCFYSFFPLGVLLSIHLFLKERNRDVYLWVLNILNVLLIIYAVVDDIPTTLAKITLLSHSSYRMVNAIGFLNLLIFIRAMAFYKLRIKSILLTFALTICGTILWVEPYINEGQKFLLVVYVAMVFYLFLLSNNNEGKKRLSYFIIIISIVGGVLVNPIQSGLNSLFDAEIVRDISLIDKSETGIWFVNGSFSYSNLPSVVGAKTLNALETYPDIELWTKLGLESDSEKWNRYCHVIGEVSDSTHAELLSVDSIKLYITVNDLKKLGVKYIFSESIIRSENCCLLASANNYYIYKIV